jgi:hypothetical protein
MKKIVLILAGVLALLPVPGRAQAPVDADFVHGTWKLVLDVGPDEGDTAGERVLSKTIGALLDEVDVRFVFEEEHRLQVISTAFGEAEVDSAEWHINEQGELLLGETGVIDDEDGVWLREDARLVSYRREGTGPRERQEGVYLERLK